MDPGEAGGDQGDKGGDGDGEREDWEERGNGECAKDEEAGEDFREAGERGEAGGRTVLRGEVTGPAGADGGDGGVGDMDEHKDDEEARGAEGLQADDEGNRMDFGKDVADGEEAEEGEGHVFGHAKRAEAVGAADRGEAPGEDEEGEEEGEARKIGVARLPPSVGKGVVGGADAHEIDPLRIEDWVVFSHLEKNGGGEGDGGDSAKSGCGEELLPTAFAHVNPERGGEHEQRVSAGEGMKIEKKPGERKGGEEAAAIGEGKRAQSHRKGDIGVSERRGIERISGEGAVVVEAMRRTTAARAEAWLRKMLRPRR